MGTSSSGVAASGGADAKRRAGSFPPSLTHQPGPTSPCVKSPHVYVHSFGTTSPDGAVFHAKAVVGRTCRSTDGWLLSPPPVSTHVPLFPHRAHSGRHHSSRPPLRVASLTRTGVPTSLPSLLLLLPLPSLQPPPLAQAPLHCVLVRAAITPASSSSRPQSPLLPFTILGARDAPERRPHRRQLWGSSSVGCRRQGGPSVPARRVAGARVGHRRPGPARRRRDAGRRRRRRRVFGAAAGRPRPGKQGDLPSRGVPPVAVAPGCRLVGGRRRLPAGAPVAEVGGGCGG